MNNLAFAFAMLFTWLCMHDSVYAQPFSKKHILSFHHCPTPNCGGPQNHIVYLAESDDAENWTLVPNYNAYLGSVPDVITRSNKLYIYTPGKVKRYDKVSNQWDLYPVNVSITDSIGNAVQFVDPSAYIDENGNVCLFFLNSTGIIGDPAQCANPPCTAYFDSAVEVVGSDGTQFVKQNGHRILYTTNSNFIPTDPDIFKSGNLFYLYISYGTGTMVYSSNSLHGNYIQVPTLPNGYLTNSNAGVPCGFFNTSNNFYYSYGHRNTANGSEITIAKHADFASQPTYSSLFTGSSIGLGNVQVASPGICENGFLATSIGEKYEEKNLIIFPNPSSGAFTIQTDSDILQINIYDIAGKIIYTRRNMDSKITITGQELMKGLYIVSCYNSQQIVQYAKLIIQ